MAHNDRQPLLRIHYRDPQDGWEGIAVVDTLVDGVAAGGVRVSRTTSAEEVVRLAQTMTLKTRAMGLPLGGAKFGLRYDPTCPRKVDALTRFFRHILPMCRSMIGFGPDMNTSPDELDEVARRIGLRTRHTALAENSRNGYENVARYDAALRTKVGPLTVLEARTGVGVWAAAEKTARSLGLRAPYRVVIQGFGQVGSGTAWFAQEAGHKVIGIADLGGFYSNENGFDIHDLTCRRGKDRLLDPGQLSPNVHRADPAGWLTQDCDILVLAANSNALTREHADRVAAKIVIEGGNLAVAPDAELLLHQRGIPVVPDFLVNGGAIGIVSGIIQLGWDTSTADVLLSKLREHIAMALDHLDQNPSNRSLTLRHAAQLSLLE